MNDAGVLQSRVWRSAFGQTRARVGAQDAADLHGHEADLTGLLNAGMRHWMPELGMWLQPDPLLLMGPSGSLLEDPLRFHPYRYARNNPVAYHAPDGGVADVLVDAAFLLYDVYSVWDDPENGVNWAAFNTDLICAAIPGATGGGVAVRVAGHADEVVDGANAVGRMDEVVGGLDEVAGGVDEVASAGDEVVGAGSELTTAPDIPGALSALSDVPWGKQCAAGCEGVATLIQKAIGGDIHRIEPAFPNAKTLGPRGGANTYWGYHEVVVKDGRVYDALTGPEGLPVDEFKALWEYSDAIHFGF